jgi:hypothetical protein
MNSYDNKSKKSKNESAANSISQNKKAAATTFQFVDNRPEAIAQLNTMSENASSEKLLPIQMAKTKGKGGGNGRQPGSKGDRSDRGVGKAAHSYEAIFANGTTATFQAGSHARASAIAGIIANRRGTTVSDVNQKS